MIHILDVDLVNSDVTTEYDTYTGRRPSNSDVTAEYDTYTGCRPCKQ